MPPCRIQILLLLFLLMGSISLVHSFSVSHSRVQPAFNKKIFRSKAMIQNSKSSYLNIKSSISEDDFDDSESSHVPLKEYFATCIPGLASTLAQELIQLGAKNVELSGTSGVSFTNDPISNEDIGMKALIWLRTAHRIMEKVASSDEYDHDDIPPWKIQDRDSLYEYIQYAIAPNIQRLLGNGKGGLLTLSVTTVLNGSLPKELCHSHYTSLTVKNAIVDLVRALRQDGIRPDVDLEDADVPFVLVLKGMRNQRNSLDISVDASLYRMLHSAGSLHKRGYRVETVHKAAMKESLAAGLLLEAGFDKLINAAKEDGLPAVLIDPMCGSGTFCLEAALIAADYAPGLIRLKYQNDNSSWKSSSSNNNSSSSSDPTKKVNPHMNPPVVRWKDSDKEYWKQLLLEAKDRATAGRKWMSAKNNSSNDSRSNVIIMGNEMNGGAFALALGNIEKAGFKDLISLYQGDCIDWHVSDAVVPGRTIVVSNPPWGLRLTEDVEQSWTSLKSFLREECNESEAWILSGSKDATRHLRMKKSRSVVIKTADEDLRWIQYHIFQKKSEGIELKR